MMYFNSISCLLCLVGIANAAVKVDYYKLHLQLFTAYSKDIQPLNNDSDTIKVSVTLRIFSLNDLEEREQTMVTFGAVEFRWFDHFLSWDPDQFNNILELVVPQDMIWRPDVIVKNSVDAPEDLGFPRLPARLYSNGQVRWSPTMLFKTSCDINIRYYPFDSQVCTIVLELAESLYEEVKLELAADQRVMVDFSPNGQWDFHFGEAKAELKSNGMSSIEYSFILERRRSFYVMNIILPILMLSFLGNLVFALPADAGEKMSLSITILLAYVVFLTIVSESMPSTSIQISLLAVYLVVLVAMSSLSVLFSTLVLRIHHKDQEVPVPPCLARLTAALCRCSVRRNTAVSVSPVGSGGKFVKKTPEITWLDVSKSMDTFFFWLYFFVTVLSTTILIIFMLSG